MACLGQVVYVDLSVALDAVVPSRRRRRADCSVGRLALELEHLEVRALGLALRSGERKVVWSFLKVAEAPFEPHLGSPCPALEDAAPGMDPGV